MEQTYSTLNLILITYRYAINFNWTIKEHQRYLSKNSWREKVLEIFAEKKEGEWIHIGVAFDRENGRTEFLITWFCYYMYVSVGVCLCIYINWNFRYWGGSHGTVLQPRQQKSFPWVRPASAFHLWQERYRRLFRVFFLTVSQTWIGIPVLLLTKLQTILKPQLIHSHI